MTAVAAPAAVDDLDQLDQTIARLQALHAEIHAVISEAMPIVRRVDGPLAPTEGRMRYFLESLVDDLDSDRGPGGAFPYWLERVTQLAAGQRAAAGESDAAAFWFSFVLTADPASWPGGTEHDEAYLQLEAWPYVRRLREAGYSPLVDELEARTRRRQTLDDLKPHILEAMAATSRPGGQS